MRKFLIVLMAAMSTVAFGGVCCGEQDCRPDCPAVQQKNPQNECLNKAILSGLDSKAAWAACSIKPSK